MAPVLTHLSSIINHFGALGVFLAAFTEEVVVPIPSALVMMSSGFFLLGAQPVSVTTLIALFFKVALPVALGLTLGSFFTYGLAYYFGKPVIERWGKWLTVTWSDVEKLERKLESGWADELVIFGFRLVPIIPSVVINIFCGLTRFPLLQYTVITFVGIIVRAYAVAFVGWQLGNTYHRYAAIVDRFENWGLALLAVLLVYWLWRRRRQQAARQNLTTHA